MQTYWMSNHHTWENKEFTFTINRQLCLTFYPVVLGFSQFFVILCLPASSFVSCYDLIFPTHPPHADTLPSSYFPLSTSSREGSWRNEMESNVYPVHEQPGQGEVGGYVVWFTLEGFSVPVFRHLVVVHLHVQLTCTRHQKCPAIETNKKYTQNYWLHFSTKLKKKKKDKNT